MAITRLKRQLEDAKRIVAPKTVILWGPEDLLGNAVEALLTAHKDWNVFRVQDEQAIAAISRDVERLKPELIVVHRQSLAGNIQPLLALVQNCPALKIITVNPENNLIEVYDKHLLHLEHISDLMSLLEESNNPKPKGGDEQHTPEPSVQKLSPVTQAGKSEKHEE